jgi:hypothetical protein
MAVATGKLTGIYFRLVKKTGLAFRSLANRLQTRDLYSPEDIRILQMSL